MLSKITNAAMRHFAQTGSRRISVSELAKLAGVARGSIYNNVIDVNSLFDIVAEQVAGDLEAMIERHIAPLEDPAERIATALQLLLWRTHEDPDWGLFACTFAIHAAPLQRAWTGLLITELRHGRDTGRFDFREDQLHATLWSIAGASLPAMLLVKQGQKPWPLVAAGLGEFTLRALGIDAQEAQQLCSEIRFNYRTP